jgi:hypothetical protein
MDFKFTGSCLETRNFVQQVNVLYFNKIVIFFANILLEEIEKIYMNQKRELPQCN